jgi:hypothetical protein
MVSVPESLEYRLGGSMVDTVVPVGEIGKGCSTDPSSGVLWSGVGLSGRITGVCPISMPESDVCGDETPFSNSDPSDREFDLSDELDESLSEISFCGGLRNPLRARRKKFKKKLKMTTRTATAKMTAITTPMTTRGIGETLREGKKAIINPEHTNRTMARYVP